MELSLCKNLPATSLSPHQILHGRRRRWDPPTTVVLAAARKAGSGPGPGPAAVAVTEEEEWMKAARVGKCGGGLVELLECLEREAIMGDDNGRDPHDYNRRAQIFDKSSRVFQALKERTGVNDTSAPDTSDSSST